MNIVREGWTQLWLRPRGRAPRRMPTIGVRLRGVLLKPGEKLVLIVDDDPEQREELAFAVEGLGYDTLSVGSGEDMLGVMMDHHPHTILLDINLPDRDGMRIAKLASGLDHRVRICLVSGDSAMVAEARDRPVGIIGVLDKPVSLRELRHILPPLSEPDRHL